MGPDSFVELHSQLCERATSFTGVALHPLGSSMSVLGSQIDFRTTFRARIPVVQLWIRHKAIYKAETVASVPGGCMWCEIQQQAVMERGILGFSL